MYAFMNRAVTKRVGIQIRIPFIKNFFFTGLMIGGSSSDG